MINGYPPSCENVGLLPHDYDQYYNYNASTVWQWYTNRGESVLLWAFKMQEVKTLFRFPLLPS